MRHHSKHPMTLAIVATLLLLGSVPIAWLLYCVAPGLFGLAIIGGLAIAQVPIFLLLKRLGAFPTDKPPDQPAHRDSAQ